MNILHFQNMPVSPPRSFPIYNITNPGGPGVIIFSLYQPPPITFGDVFLLYPSTMIIDLFHSYRPAASPLCRI
jgi:hypothetical protein